MIREENNLLGVIMHVSFYNCTRRDLQSMPEEQTQVEMCEMFDIEIEDSYFETNIKGNFSEVKIKHEHDCRK